MTTQNYCMVDTQTNICDNVVMWDGDTNTWQPPADHLMLVQATTPAKIWEWDGPNAQWVLTPTNEPGGIGFFWNGEFLLQSELPPDPPVPPEAAPDQPTTDGAQEL